MKKITMKKITCIVFAFCSYFTLPSLAQESAGFSVAPELHRDPFEKPGDAIAITPETADEAVVSTTQETAPREHFLWRPELRGIIRSEDVAIVNIGGKMLGLGEEIEGFTLINVKERTVVFEKDGQTLAVSLDQEDETDEQNL